MSATGDASDRRSSQAGTTLIEALTVVAIITMVSLIVFPRMQQGLLTLQQHHTVALVAARLRQARAEALRQDTRTVFALTPDGQAFGVLGEASIATIPGIVLSTPSGPGGRIVFDADGSSSGGVVLVTAARRTLAISVSRPGGAVAVSAG